jgi:dihydroxy-acid dehydratase
VREVLEEASSAFPGRVEAGLNKYSSNITQPKSQGASQAMLYATGLREEDMSKPQVCGT